MYFLFFIIISARIVKFINRGIGDNLISHDTLSGWFPENYVLVSRA